MSSREMAPADAVHALADVHEAYAEVLRAADAAAALPEHLVLELAGWLRDASLLVLAASVGIVPDPP